MNDTLAGPPGAGMEVSLMAKEDICFDPFDPEFDSFLALGAKEPPPVNPGCTNAAVTGAGLDVGVDTNTISTAREGAITPPPFVDLLDDPEYTAWLVRFLNDEADEPPGVLLQQTPQPHVRPQHVQRVARLQAELAVRQAAGSNGSGPPPLTTAPAHAQTPLHYHAAVPHAEASTAPVVEILDEMIEGEDAVAAVGDLKGNLALSNRLSAPPTAGASSLQQATAGAALATSAGSVRSTSQTMAGLPGGVLRAAGTERVWIRYGSFCACSACGVQMLSPNFVHHKKQCRNRKMPGHQADRIELGPNLGCMCSCKNVRPISYFPPPTAHNQKPACIDCRGRKERKLQEQAALAAVAAAADQGVASLNAAAQVLSSRKRLRQDEQPDNVLLWQVAQPTQEQTAALALLAYLQPGVPMQ